MDARERILAGTLGGAVGTLALSGLREAFSRMGLVFETAPMQVVDRAQEVGLVDGDVRLQRNRNKLIDHVALDHPVRSPVVGKPDGVDLAPVEAEDGDAVGD